MSAADEALPPTEGPHSEPVHHERKSGAGAEGACSAEAEIHTAPSVPRAVEHLQAPSPDVDVSYAPSVPPVIDVFDLDWESIRAVINPAMIRARMRGIVESFEIALDSVVGPRMLFDGDRQGSSDRAIQVSAVPTAPLWFIGDLHGDLLALESALALIAREGETSDKSYRFSR